MPLRDMLNRTATASAAHRYSDSHGKNPQSLNPRKPWTMTTAARAWGGASMSPRIGSPSRDEISNIEAEQNHVAVLDLVLFSFAAHFARSFRALLSAELHVIVVADRLGANEAALEVAVDHAGSLRRARSAMDRPRPRFLGTRGEKRLQAEEFVGGADEDVEAGLGQSHLAQELAPLVGWQLRDLRFELAAD